MHRKMESEWPLTGKARSRTYSSKVKWRRRRGRSRSRSRGRRRSRGGGRPPPVPANFPQGVLPFVPYEHAAQTDMRRALLPPSFGKVSKLPRRERMGGFCIPGCARRLGVRQNDSTGHERSAADSVMATRALGQKFKTNAVLVYGLEAVLRTVEQILVALILVRCGNCLLVFSNSSLTTRCSPFSPTIRTPMLNAIASVVYEVQRGEILVVEGCLGQADTLKGYLLLRVRDIKADCWIGIVIFMLVAIAGRFALPVNISPAESLS